MAARRQLSNSDYTALALVGNQGKFIFCLVLNQVSNILVMIQKRLWPTEEFPYNFTVQILKLKN